MMTSSTCLRMYRMIYTCGLLGRSGNWRQGEEAAPATCTTNSSRACTLFLDDDAPYDYEGGGAFSGSREKREEAAGAMERTGTRMVRMGIYYNLRAIGSSRRIRLRSR